MAAPQAMPYDHETLRNVELNTILIDFRDEHDRIDNDSRQQEQHCRNITQLRTQSSAHVWMMLLTETIYCIILIMRSEINTTWQYTDHLTVTLTDG